MWIVLVVGFACGAPVRPRPPEAHPPVVIPEVAATLVAQVGGSGEVGAAVFTPDGRILVTANGDGTLRAWQVETGRLLRAFLGHRGIVTALAVSPDGRVVASVGEDRSARAWELATARSRWIVERPEEVGAGRSIAFSPDGAEIAIGGVAGRIAIVDAATGANQRVVGGQGGEIWALAWDARYGLLAGSDSGSLIAWDPATGARGHVYQLGGDRIWSLAWLPSGQLAVGLDGGAALGDAKTAKLLGGDDAPRYAKSVSATIDGSRIVVGAESSLRVYRGDGTLDREIAVPPGYVDASRVSPDGRWVFAQSRGEPAVIYDARSGVAARTLARPREPVSSLVFSPDGTRLYVASGSSQEHPSSLAFSGERRDRITAWDLVLAKPHHSFSGEMRPVRALALMPDGKTLLSGHDAGAVRMWDADRGDPGGTLGKDDGGTHALAVSADGRVIVAGQQYGLVVFDGLGTSGRSIGGNHGMTYSVAVTPDGRWATYGGNTGEVELAPATPGATPRARDAGPSMVTAVAFTPDSAHVVTGHADGEVRVWNVATGERTAAFAGHVGEIESLAVSPDGAIVASGGEDGTVRLWDLASGAAAPRRVLLGHGGAVTALAFRKDGRWLASGGQDATARLWDLDSAHVVALVGDVGSWIVYGEDGYFDASPDGVALAAAVVGDQAFGVDQFALRRNRPDVLLERLGKADGDAIAYFRDRWLRRLRKAGIAEDAAASFHVPRATLIETTDDGKFAVVTARLEDDAADLARYQITVNGVPVLGDDGKPVTGRAATIRERVELVSGANRIDVSVTNVAGAESLHAESLVTYAPRVEPELYFVGFGVSAYKDRRLALDYAHRDALDLEVALGKTTGFRAFHHKTYTDKAVTRRALDDAAVLIGRARPDDVVVLFFAGHGIHARDAQAAYFYAGYETDIERLADTAIPFDAIDQLARATRARHKLLLLDTCESGDDADDAASVVARPGARSLRSRALKVVRRQSAAAPRRAYVVERDRFIHDDLFGRSGTIVLSSSRGGESSYESAELQHGLFTTDLLAALTTPVADTGRDGRVSTDELRAYLPRAVAVRSRGAQNPTVDRDNLFAHFAFGLPGVAKPAPARPARPKPPRAAPASDRDGDGVADDVDQCPDDPEDFDGEHDDDGCPDPDNDRDGILDIDDLCPNDPEDKDGFEDDDGCPDPDNDRDRVLDKDDACPNQPGKPPNGCP